MDKCKVSVLITAYNLEKYIAGTIESVLRQKGDFQMEILVGDDGSEDNTVSVVNEYIARYPEIISLYEVPREKGVSYNRVERSSFNRINLLEKAKGEYICFLDGDDFYIDERKLEKQLEVLENDKSLSICAHNVVMYYGEDTPLTIDNGGQLLTRAKKRHKWTFENYWTLEFIQANAMLYRNYYNKGSEAFTKPLKEVLEENAGLRHNFDDNNITLAFFMYGDMYYMPDVMVAYRQSENSSWNGIDELKKHCSNMIGFTIENALINGYESNLNKKMLSLSYARHYKDLAYISSHKEELNIDNCQPFYSTALKCNLNLALLIYNMNQSDGGMSKQDFNKLLKKSKKQNTLAKCKRVLKKTMQMH